MFNRGTKHKSKPAGAAAAAAAAVFFTIGFTLSGFLNKSHTITGFDCRKVNSERDSDGFIDIRACSDLFNHPEFFGGCVQSNPRPSCSPKQSHAWNEVVSLRYDSLNGTCLVANPDEPRRHGPSGPGSSLSATESLREMFPTLFNELDIKTFMDCPCGDWLWMQTVDLDGVQYFGGDITRVTIEENMRCHSKNNVHFLEFDWTCQVPPPVDLILLRDVLFHLPPSTTLDVLYNVNLSGAKYLATTTFSEKGSVWKVGPAYPETLEKRIKEDENVIGFSFINLYDPPYNFPPPLYVAKEEGTRHVGVWKLPLDHIDF